MFTRREWESEGHARSMCTLLRAPSEAAHPMQPRPDGTKRSRHVQLRHSRPFQCRDFRVAARCTEEKFTAALVPSVEAWAVIVSPGTQETLAMLKAILLAASTSGSEVE